MSKIVFLHNYSQDVVMKLNTDGKKVEAETIWLMTGNLLSPVEEEGEEDNEGEEDSEGEEDNERGDNISG